MTEKAPPLPCGEVHVWCVSLDDSPVPLSDLWAILSDEERQRAMRFPAQKDRERFITCRGLLREVLNSYTRSGPGHLRFGQGQYGKPFLTGAESVFSFNASHCGSRALFAVARGGRVGVDIQSVRDDVNFERFAARFFSDHEQAELTALPLPCRRLAFFHGWVRKEAYLKARGDGLTFPLDRFSISLSPYAARLAVIAPDVPDPALWFLREIDPGGGGHVAALAVQGRRHRVRVIRG